MQDANQLNHWKGRILALVGIVLIAANLRTAVAALSPIFGHISQDFPLSSLEIGLLGMLPTVFFAGFGLATPVFTKRWSLESVTVFTLIVIGIGHLFRAFSSSFMTLFLGSAIVFAAIGVGNVLLPPLAKKYFPHNIGFVTSVYATVLAVSTFVPPLVAVPVADAMSWQFSLGMWAILAGIALFPWARLLYVEARRRIRPTLKDRVEITHRTVAMWRSPVALAIMIVFAVSSIMAFSMFAWLPEIVKENAGVSPVQAGLLLSLYSAMGVPGGLIVPVLAARMKRVELLVYLAAVLAIVGSLGLVWMPVGVTWLWVTLAGLGTLMFPLCLVLITLRTETHEMSASLSGFVQGFGYLLSAIGPFLVGALRQASGGWDVPMLFLVATVVVAVGAGYVLRTGKTVEQNLSI